MPEHIALMRLMSCMTHTRQVTTMPTPIEGVTFYTIPEVAEAPHITPQTVRAYIKQGKLQSQRIGRPILITEKNLREFLKNRNQNYKLPT